MSRIILTRHPNGEEHIVAGRDRPLQTCFVDEYDDEGECVRTRGPLSGEMISPLMAAAIVSKLVATIDTVRLATALVEHSRLEYPASNRVEDWTT